MCRMLPSQIEDVEFMPLVVASIVHRNLPTSPACCGLLGQQHLQQPGPHMLLATYESTACCLWDLPGAQLADDW